MGSGRRIGCSIDGSGAIVSGRGSESGKLSLNLVEEGVNFFLVVAGPEPGRTELLVPHIRGRQRHLVSSARLAVFLSTRVFEAPLFLSTVPVISTVHGSQVR